MAKIGDVIKQLQAIMPKQTDFFHDTLEIIAITNPSGTIFNIETSAAHGLVDDEVIGLEDVLVKNDITTVTDLGDNIIKFETTVPHDLTEGFQKEVYLFGFTSPSNGFYPLVNVSSLNEFTVDLNAVPVGSGSLGEDRVGGIGGRHKITVLDTTNFRIAVPTATFFEFIVVGNQNVIVGIRISGVGDPSRFIEYYSAQGSLTDFWAYVVNQPSNVSFNRSISSDANQRMTLATDFRFEVIQNFIVYVVAPTTDTFGARLISDIMIDIRTFLCKALCGVSFPSGFKTEIECNEVTFRTTFLGDNFFQYVGAYYVHEFTFETVANFNPSDAVDPIDTAAFRCFDLGIRLGFDNFTDVKKTIEGDLP